MQLETERLLIRDFTEADFEAVYAYSSTQKGRAIWLSRQVHRKRPMDNSRPELNSQVLRASGQCHAKHLFLFAEQLHCGKGLALLYRPSGFCQWGAGWRG